MKYLICALLICLSLSACKTSNQSSRKTDTKACRVGYVSFQLPLSYDFVYDDSEYKSEAHILKDGNFIVSLHASAGTDSIQDLRKEFTDSSATFLQDTISHFLRQVSYFKTDDSYSFDVSITNFCRMHDTHTFIDSLGHYALYLTVRSYGYGSVSLSDCQQLFPVFSHCIIDTAAILRDSIAFQKRMDSVNRGYIR